MTDPHVKLDLERRARIGIEEAVLCEGKSAAQIDTVLDCAASANASMLLTRLSADRLASLAAHHRAQLDHDTVSRTAYFAWTRPVDHDAAVAVLSAGTSDAPVAREAARTLRYYGIATHEIGDVGVAGIWRLMARVEEFRALPVVIVVAGMDAALPSVVGGLVPGLVVAVPTSTGYGVAAGGTTALYAALASCAPGIAVVNIDNGYGAACVALRALSIGCGVNSA
ncbi:MAG: nickel pincer cofactor biosynthesis protein LarB [Alphaproteobacteria bacterium]|nr:nickel pincer cofactor biosynthesis protein LarB [Alphaproteobacteria bacterium]